VLYKKKKKKKKKKKERRRRRKFATANYCGHKPTQ